MKAIIAFLVAIGLAVPASAKTHDVREGTFEAPDDFTFTHTGTADSFMGTLVRNSDGFTIHFDVGAMAGTRMTPLRQDTTAFFRTHVINDNFAYTGIERRDGRQTVATTICDWCERSRRFVEESDAIRLLPEEQREEKYRELNERRSQFDDLNKGLPMIANFWADVTRDEDLAEFLIIVNSYKLKPR